jgi:hypothetical protein
MSGYGNGYICEGTYVCGYACSPPATEGGAPADASPAAEGVDAEAGVTAGCAANITIKNVAFYGQGTPSQPAACSGITPASAAITGNVATMVNGTVVYGNAPTAWVAYSAASTGQVKPALAFDTAVGSFNANVPVTQAADGSYSFGALGLAFLQSTESAGICANGSGYAGVSFDIEGDFGACKATFVVVTSEDQPPGQRRNLHRLDLLRAELRPDPDRHGHGAVYGACGRHAAGHRRPRRDRRLAMAVYAVGVRSAADAGCRPVRAGATLPARVVGGAVECWGTNANGQLGKNSTVSSAVPVPVATLTSGVTAVSVGCGTACAITVGGGSSRQAYIATAESEPLRIFPLLVDPHQRIVRVTRREELLMSFILNRLTNLSLIGFLEANLVDLAINVLLAGSVEG